VSLYRLIFLFKLSFFFGIFFSLFNLENKACLTKNFPKDDVKIPHFQLRFLFVLTHPTNVAIFDTRLLGNSGTLQW